MGTGVALTTAEKRGTKNTLEDLNNHLFAQVEAIMDAESNEDFEKEAKRTAMLNTIAKTVIENARLVLEAVKVNNELLADTEMPHILTARKKDG
jgi:hypothetical protein